MNLRTLIAIASLVLPAAATTAAAQDGEPAAAREDLAAIPEPNFEGADPSVARAILEQLDQTRRLAADSATPPADLAKAFGELGQSLLLYDLLEPAEAAFRNAAALVTEDHRAPYYLGVIAQELRRLDEAKERFRAVLALDPQYVSALVRLGDIELLENRPDEAKAYYESVLALYPASPAAHWGLGQIAASRGDPQTAVEHFEAVLEAQPAATAAHYPLALAYRELGDLDKAREHLALRGERPVQRVDPLVDGLARRVTGGSLYMTRGNQAFDRGDFDVATEAYQKAVEADPSNNTARHALASSLSRGGDLDEAAEQLQQILQQDPDDAVAHYNLGTLFSELGAPEQALQHMQRAVELSPDMANARFNLGILLERLARFEEALDQYAELRRLDPQDTAGAVRHAALLIRLDRAGEAESELRAILAVDPGNAEARMVLAAALAGSGQLQAALTELRQLNESTDNVQTQARAHFEAARLLMAAGEGAAAIEELQATVTIMPRLVEAREALATALARARRFDEAAEQFDRIVQLQPESLQAHLGRAVALLLDRQDARARASLEESLGALPTAIDLAHLLARILAASEDPTVRDGQRALAMSQQIQSQQPTPRHQATVAMALAELGRFDEAIELQTEILRQARRVDSSDLAGIERRLRQYEDGRPARSPWLQNR